MSEDKQSPVGKRNAGTRAGWKAFIVFTREEEVSEDWVYALGRIREAFMGTEVTFISTRTSPVIIGDAENPDAVIDIQQFLEKYGMGYLVVQQGDSIRFLGDHGGFYFPENEKKADPIETARRYFGLEEQ